MDTLTLSQTDTRRLEKLAYAAGHTPKDILKHVLRDGFEATEYAVKVVGRACKALSVSRTKMPCSSSTT